MNFECKKCKYQKYCNMKDLLPVITNLFSFYGLISCKRFRKSNGDEFNPVTIYVTGNNENAIEEACDYIHKIAPASTIIAKNLSVGETIDIEYRLTSLYSTISECDLVVYVYGENYKYGTDLEAIRDVAVAISHGIDVIGYISNKIKEKINGKNI